MSENASKHPQGLERLAREQSRLIVRRDPLTPGEGVDAVVVGLPWRPVMLIGAGAIFLCLGLLALRGVAEGLAVSCLGVFGLSYGLWMLARESIVVRYGERRNHLGAISSTEGRLGPMPRR